MCRLQRALGNACAFIISFKCILKGTKADLAALRATPLHLPFLANSLPAPPPPYFFWYIFSMTQFSLEAVLPGTDPAAWLVERHHSAVLSIQAQVLTLERLEVVAAVQRGPSTYLTLVTAPHAGAWVPSAAAKHLPGGGDFELVDTIEIADKVVSGPPFEMDIVTEIPALGCAASIRSRMVIEAAGNGTTRQALHCDVRVRLGLGLGK